MADHYKRLYSKKPGGILPFRKNGAGHIIVNHDELFCRFETATGAICPNNHRFKAANSLRLHIKLQHDASKCARMTKPTQEMLAAEADYEACYEAILAYDIELREASIAHDQISVPTKERRREESSPKSSKKLKLAQYVNNDDEEEAEKPSHPKPEPALIVKFNCTAEFKNDSHFNLTMSSTAAVKGRTYNMVGKFIQDEDEN